jgi:GNAT superfamily N-acetyltransferase
VTSPDVAVVPLTDATWDALVGLFSERGSDAHWCWCMFWRRSAKDFGAATVADHRAGLRALVDGPLPPGLVALRDGKAVGWVGLGPRRDFARIERSRVLPKVDSAPVWSIVCFAVSPSARGEGITTALLDAAVEWARAQGVETLEAYPVDVGDEPVDPDALFTGRRSVFERAGFHVAAPTTSSAGGRPRVVVRRSLSTS